MKTTLFIQITYIIPEHIRLRFRSLIWSIHARRSRVHKHLGIWAVHIPCQMKQYQLIVGFPYLYRATDRQNPLDNCLCHHFQNQHKSFAVLFVHYIACYSTLDSQPALLLHEEVYLIRLDYVLFLLKEIFVFEFGVFLISIKIFYPIQILDTWFRRQFAYQHREVWSLEWLC